MAKANDALGTAQEAFNAALSRSAETVTSLRRRRTRETAELPAVNMGRLAYETAKQPAAVPVRHNKMRITIPGMNSLTDFDAVIMLIERLSQLSNEERGEIICRDRDQLVEDNNGFTCAGFQSLWTRAGKEPPTVRYTDAPLAQVFDEKPVAVFTDPKDAPENVAGYLRVVLEQPRVCMYLRKG